MYMYMYTYDDDATVLVPVVRDEGALQKSATCEIHISLSLSCYIYQRTPCLASFEASAAIRCLFQSFVTRVPCRGGGVG